MIALMGDAELDEGNVYECLQEGWKHDLRNCWWVVDYNRQSLDGVVREGLWQRIEAIFGAFGWEVVRLKHGVLQRAAFAEPGGTALRDWIDACPNQDYAALTFMGGAVWRRRLMDDLGDQGEVSALIERRSDAELYPRAQNGSPSPPSRTRQVFVTGSTACRSSRAGHDGNTTTACPPPHSISRQSARPRLRRASARSSTRSPSKVARSPTGWSPPRRT
jgi:hypothetical protein